MTDRQRNQNKMVLLNPLRRNHRQLEIFNVVDLSFLLAIAILLINDDGSFNGIVMPILDLMQDNVSLGNRRRYCG